MFNVENVLKQLTLEEKILLCQAKDMWHTNGVERLGIPGILMTDGPNGIRYNKPNSPFPEPSTAIPTESILSASWDRNLIRTIATLLAEECQYYGISVLLAPGVNAKRSPLGGRNFEYYSEDPFLTGTLASELIQTLQANGVGASIKHYTANDQETRRLTENSSISERTLHEICLKPFEIAIKSAKPWTLMAAYPKFRGQHICENSYLLEEILRKEYHYEGVVLSDWGATVNKTESHKNGLDLEMGSFYRKEELFSALLKKEIDIETIDLHVRRILNLINFAQNGKKEISFDWNSHHEIARKAASKSAVLLKNENGILPLAKGTSVAVLGKLAECPHIRGGGSSGTNSNFIDIPLTFIKKYAKVVYVRGYESNEVNTDLIQAAIDIAKNVDTVIIFTGTTDLNESEGCDRTDMLLPESQIELVNAVAKINPKIIIVNSSGAPVEFRQIDNSSKAILHMGLAGEGMGKACADLLFGEVNPSGKLSETFPVQLENTPAYPFYPEYNDNVTYREEFLVGYRYYDTKKIPVQYPFGYGLSYTSFEYSDLRLSSNEMRNGDRLKIWLKVKNTGLRTGEEIVQFYISDPISYMPRPEKELKEFVKIELTPGETKEICIELDDSAFSYYVPHLHRYAIESGEFIIMAAASSQDIRLQKSIMYYSKDELRLPFTQYNTMGEFYNDNRYEKIAKKVYAHLGISENHFMFPILSSITLKRLPDVQALPKVTPEGEKIDIPKLQRCLLENKWID